MKILNCTRQKEWDGIEWSGSRVCLRENKRVRLKEGENRVRRVKTPSPPLPNPSFHLSFILSRALPNSLTRACSVGTMLRATAVTMRLSCWRKLEREKEGARREQASESGGSKKERASAGRGRWREMGEGRR